ncbi:Wall-associated receptor kinase 2 [Raphanus sativus]|nr:Wall-associated receptor kinase 2 [Raphanus sativus]
MKIYDLLLIAIFFLAYTKLVKSQSLSGCQTKCGNVSIEYPFGTSQGCYYPGDNSFKLTCNETNKLIFGGNEVINITPSGELRVLVTRSYVCYNSQGNQTGRSNRWTRLGNVTFSDKNRFTAVGCNTYAFLNTNEVTQLDACQHVTLLGRQMDHVLVEVAARLLFLEGATTSESSEDLMNLRNITRFPVVLDWSIGKHSCQQVGSANICGWNSVCSNSVRGTGYICKCKEGFDGNPYLSNENGCQDINECTTNSTIHNHRHNCSDSSNCVNTMGHFLCTCPSGFNLNATTNSCMRKGNIMDGLKFFLEQPSAS